MRRASDLAGGAAHGRGTELPAGVGRCGALRGLRLLPAALPDRAPGLGFGTEHPPPLLLLQRLRLLPREGHSGLLISFGRWRSWEWAAKVAQGRQFSGKELGWRMSTGLKSPASGSSRPCTWVRLGAWSSLDGQALVTQQHPRGSGD